MPLQATRGKSLPVSFGLEHSPAQPCHSSPKKRPGSRIKNVGKVKKRLSSGTPNTTGKKPKKRSSKAGLPSKKQAGLEPIPVSVHRWQSRFPDSWLRCLTPDHRHYVCPQAWLPWMHYQQVDCPGNDTMSRRLWPALTQLITVIYLLEQKTGHRPLEQNPATHQAILSEWQLNAQTFDLISIEEIQTSLFLCKTALARHSPLSNQQKHFVMQFVACRTIQVQLATDIFKLLTSLDLPFPALDHDSLGSPAADNTQLYQRGRKLFGDQWPTVGQTIKSMVERAAANINYEATPVDHRADRFPPEQVAILPEVWRMAVTFLNIWWKDSTVDLNYEFNVGREDKMNSEYFATALRHLLGCDSSLSVADKQQLTLLLDLTLHICGVTLTLNGRTVDWRDWLLAFQPGVHSLPREDEPLTPRTPITVASEHRAEEHRQGPVVPRPRPTQLARRVSSTSSHSDQSFDQHTLRRLFRHTGPGRGYTQFSPSPTPTPGEELASPLSWGTVSEHSQSMSSTPRDMPPPNLPSKRPPGNSVVSTMAGKRLPGDNTPFQRLNQNHSEWTDQASTDSDSDEER